MPSKTKRNGKAGRGFAPRSVMPRRAIAEMIRRTQDDNRDIIAQMPNRATNAGQLKLQKKHGTPREFAAGCVSAIGEISPLEAHVAIRKYLDEWNAA